MMEEITKKDLITVIGENLTDIRHDGYRVANEEDLSEMPYRIPNKEKEPNPEKEWEPMFDVDPQGKPQAHIGWYHHGQPVVFTCDFEEFKTQYPNAIERLQEKFGNVKWSERVCPDYKPRAAYKSTDIKPLPGEEGEEVSVLTPYEASGESYTESEKIKRQLHPLLEDSIENDSNLNQFFLKSSLPPLVVNDPKHIDRHSETENDSIIYSTHSINEYETQTDFLKAVTLRLQGKETEVSSPKYLARQFNKRYRNWDLQRRTDKRNYGKTEKLNLDRFGVPDMVNNEVLITAWFTLKGRTIERNDENQTTKYKWDLEYVVRYGKKPADSGMVRKLQDDLLIKKDLVVELSEPKDFNNNDTVLSDLNIREGLVQVITDFKEELTSMNPQQIAIKKATKRASELESN